MNMHPPERPPPKMIEAFAHPAGSVAVTKDGGATQWRGVLLHIHIAPSASYEMEELAEAECVVGRGIVGDRYHNGLGTYSPKPDVREVTLIEQEALDALSRNDPPLQQGPITLEPRDHRRNLTVKGVPLNHLVGRRFRVGDVILRGGRLNFPCKYLEELLGLPVFLPLYNRSGLNCGIERGGIIRPGDEIELLSP
ncbi:MOSC domain-containing protein [Bradyrhizobium cenepequi]